MAPGRKSRSVRSGNIQEGTSTSPISNQATPAVGVTKAELDAAILGLNQQINAQNAQFEAQNAQNALILNRLKDLLGANRQPAGNERNFTGNIHDAEERNAPERAASPFEQTLPEVGGSRTRHDEEYLSGMVRQIMKESMQRVEDEKEWGFAPSKTPFTEKILKAEFPRKFVPPTIPAYKGTSDPNEFLYKYDWHMTGARASDEIKCRYFPVYLEGVALLWFTKLAVRSIDQFSDLTKKFKEQFRLYASKAKDIMSLSSLEQNPGESIKSFLN